MAMKIKTTMSSTKKRKRWLSDLSKSSYVTEAVSEEAIKAKRKAEVKVASKHETGFKWHYGSTSLKGKWGNTVLIWPTTPAARKHPEYVRSAIRTTSFKLKDGKK